VTKTTPKSYLAGMAKTSLKSQFREKKIKKKKGLALAKGNGGDFGHLQSVSLG
jgi:hypothetical protein